MAKAPARPAAPRWPWDKVAFEVHEISALKAIPAGAFAAIEKLCGAGINPFTAGGEDGRRATDFGCGKMWVANSLRAIRELKLPGPKPAASGPHDTPKGDPPPMPDQ